MGLAPTTPFSKVVAWVVHLVVALARDASCPLQLRALPLWPSRFLPPPQPAGSRPCVVAAAAPTRSVKHSLGSHEPLTSLFEGTYQIHIPPPSSLVTRPFVRALCPASACYIGTHSGLPSY